MSEIIKFTKDNIKKIFQEKEKYKGWNLINIYQHFNDEKTSFLISNIEMDLFIEEKNTLYFNYFYKNKKQRDSIYLDKKFTILKIDDFYLTNIDEDEFNILFKI